MRFVPTKLPGVVVVEPMRVGDDRGHFARTWCVREFASFGLDTKLVQCSTSYNRRRGTLRGMHYQAAPYEEVKLVRCTRGAAYDVVVDLRPDSPTFRRWVAVELSADNGVAVYIPGGCAHGYQTLTDDTELVYLISEFYHPKSARGVRWDDPAVGVEWPECANRIIAAKDLAYPDLPP
jgi:dTDP-4-dehydrorhamnose 3,5-epimerase